MNVLALDLAMKLFAAIMYCTCALAVMHLARFSGGDSVRLVTPAFYVPRGSAIAPFQGSFGWPTFQGCATVVECGTFATQDPLEFQPHHIVPLPANAQIVTGKQIPTGGGGNSRIRVRPMRREVRNLPQAKMEPPNSLLFPTL